MGTPTTRVLTPARVVALVIVAMLVAGLVYIRFASQPDTVLVAVVRALESRGRPGR